MTVATRELGSAQWQHRVLPSKVGWDSHNSITMAMDDQGQLHVVGNMHASPLVYFRTRKPGRIETLERHAMTGELEKRTTYPQFIKDPEGRLLFSYRHGGSGNGVRIWNRYDARHQSWSRLVDTPLMDGQGDCNAYPLGPTRGPDGDFHMVWVWRDTPDCETNHHLSYARSKDLIHWQSAFGKNADLPITLDQKFLWVDPIPTGGGIINGGHRLLFDDHGKPLIVYHKNDEAGHMQIYAARPGKAGWQRRVLTDWEKPVKFSGRGSMGFIGIRLGNVEWVEPGLLVVDYYHQDYGKGQLWLDGETLQPVDRRVRLVRPYPAAMSHITSDFECMSIRHAADIGRPPEAGIRYLLQWETLGANHDRPRQPPLPEPSTLWLYKLRQVKE